jgi:hypothetical protein
VRLNDNNSGGHGWIRIHTGSDWRSFGVHAGVALRNLPYDPLTMTTAATAMALKQRRFIPHRPRLMRSAGRPSDRQLTPVSPLSIIRFHVCHTKENTVQSTFNVSGSGAITTVLTLLAITWGLFISIFWMVCGWRAMCAHEVIAQSVYRLSLNRTKPAKPETATGQ